MKLVKIKEYLYLNSDFIESVEADSEESVIITMTSGEVFSPNVSIKKALDAICGSEGHSLIGYKKMKNKDLIQKAYVYVNNICGSEEHSVEYEDAESYRQDNKYNISITTDNTGSNKVGTRSQVLSLLDQLKNDETLTIKLTK